MSTPAPFFTCPHCGGEEFAVTCTVTMYQTYFVERVTPEGDYEVLTDTLGETSDGSDFYEAECCECDATLDEHPMLPDKASRARQQAQRQYRAESSHCPYCGADEVQGDSIEVIDRRAYQEMGCLACDKSWTDVYDLAGFLREESHVQDMQDIADSRPLS